ncbi:MAG: CHAD domain-containing protein [Acidobacteriia bacterium]|nr:CHAD domain-containing protein [Terriglobia bacterium]
MKKLVQLQTARRLKTLDREVGLAARRPKDPEAIHDLRVSIRRLRQELNVFEEWLKPGPAKRIRGNLKKLMERCAAVRNCDIALEVLQAAGCQSPKLASGLEKDRRRARAELADKLTSWRKEDRVGRWRGDLRVAHSAPKHSVEETARRVLPAMVTDLFRAGREAARPSSTHERMHRLRLEAKRVRYTLELFAQVYGTKTKPILESLKTLQDKLGAINDCATTLEMIRRDREAAAAVQRLAGERETAFREHWKQHFGPRERIRWKAVLHTADGKK